MRVVFLSCSYLLKPLYNIMCSGLRNSSEPCIGLALKRLTNDAVLDKQVAHTSALPTYDVDERLLAAVCLSTPYLLADSQYQGWGVEAMQSTAPSRCR